MPRKKTDISFQAFWDAYGLKRNRIATEGVWARLSEKDRRAALAGIAAYQEECRRTGIAMMHGKNYLKYRRWEDEITPKEGKAPHPECNEKSLFSGNALEDMDIW